MVCLQSTDNTVIVQAELLNLSIGGMCVYAPALRSQSAGRWLASISLEPGAEPLIVPAERVHTLDSEQACWGFRFLNSADAPGMKAREKTIWKFLLDEQRRRRRTEEGSERPLDIYRPAASDD